MWDLPGAYRPLLVRPTNLEASLLPYSDHKLPLEPSDVDAFERGRAQAAAASSHADDGASRADVPPPEAPASAQPATAQEPRAEATEGSTERSRLAWRVRFELPASAYATCLVRELLGQPLEAHDHKRRSKAALSGP